MNHKHFQYFCESWTWKQDSLKCFITKIIPSFSVKFSRVFGELIFQSFQPLLNLNQTIWFSLIFFKFIRVTIFTITLAKCRHRYTELHYQEDVKSKVWPELQVLFIKLCLGEEKVYISGIKEIKKRKNNITLMMRFFVSFLNIGPLSTTYGSNNSELSSNPSFV